jgi:hypothetical protein
MGRDKPEQGVLSAGESDNGTMVASENYSGSYFTHVCVIIKCAT